MARIIRELSFEEWVVHVFDHEGSGPEWYFDPDCDFWDGPADNTIEYITRLFTDPMRYLQSYTDEQLGRGLWFLVSNGASDQMFALLDSAVLLETRLKCVRSFCDLFGKLFAKKCSSHLSHVDEPGANPINVVCYMWWDLFPVAGSPDDAAGQALNRTILDVMEHSLNLDSIACQESALHGLGHWMRTYQEQVHEIIDSFLAGHPAVRPELQNYARQARDCCIQ